jgi:exopolysaccharide production protein ExoZ
MPGEKINSLQVLRALAATGVIIVHYWQPLNPHYSGPHIGAIGLFGRFGVDVFFVISGFIIATTAPKRAPGDLLRRRVARIVPLYWLITAFYIVILLGIHRFEAGQLVSSVFFIPTLAVGPVIGPGWSLCYEMLFYITVSAILVRPRIGLPMGLAALGCALVARQLWGGPAFLFLGSPLILEFLCGAALAIAPRSRLAAALAAASAVVLLILVWRTGYEGLAPTELLDRAGTWLRVAMLAAPATLIVYATLHLELSVASWRPLIYLGEASFAAYIVHQPVEITFILLKYVIGPLPCLVIGVIVAWTFAILVHEAAERPLAGLFARRWMAAPATPLAPLRQNAD